MADDRTHEGSMLSRPTNGSTDASDHHIPLRSDPPSMKETPDVQVKDGIPLQETPWTGTEYMAEEETNHDIDDESSKWVSDVSYDDLLTSLGEFGWRQKMVAALVSYHDTNIAFQIISSVFVMAVVSHRCAIPGLANDTWTIQNEGHALLVNLTIPPGVSQPYSGCLTYTDVWLDGRNRTQLHGSADVDVEDYKGNGFPLGSTRNSTTACDQYVYDTSRYESTITMDLDLVCGRSMYRSHAQMMIMLGCLVGSQMAGLISDTWGRKLPMTILMMVNVVSMFCITLVRHYSVLLFVVFLVGMSCMGAACSGFMIGLEMLGPSKRVWLGVMTGTFFSTGLLVLSLLAYFLRDWTSLHLACSAFTLPYLAYWWLVPESPRWLLIKGRVKEAQVILSRIARANKKTFDPAVLHSLHISSAPQMSLWNVLFHTQKLIGRHLIIFFSWFVASFSYYGVSYNVGSLGGNVYLNMATGALMDIGFFLLCAPFMTRFGRRPLSSVFFFVTGVACIATLFPVIYASEDQQWMTVVLALMGRCSMAVAFAFIWVYSSELFPTVMRNSGHGAASMCARVGGLVAPYVANMSLDGAAGKAIPLVIFGVPSIVVSLLTLCLPETLNRSLPDSVEDAVSMSRPKSCQPVDRSSPFYFLNEVSMADDSTHEGSMLSRPTNGSTDASDHHIPLRSDPPSMKETPDVQVKDSIPLQKMSWKGKELEAEEEAIDNEDDESSKWVRGMSYDDLLTSLGEFGWRQKMVTVWVSFHDCNLGIQLLSSVFIMAVVSHRCAIPGLANDTWTIQNEGHALLVNLTIPPGVSQPYSGCLIWLDGWNRTQLHGSGSSDVDVDHQENGKEEEAGGSTGNYTTTCDRYVYDTSTYESSISMDLDLVCGRSMYRSHAQMMIMLGCLVGSQMAGLISDTWGRKLPMMILMVVNVVSMFCLTFVRHYSVLLLVVFLVGMSAMGAMCPGFMIGLEVMGPSKRIWLGLMSGVSFSFGMLLLSFLAYFIRDWTTLQLVCSAFTLPYLAYWWLVPESPRWLLIKGRVKEAQVILSRIARANKKTFDPAVLHSLHISSAPQMSLWKVLFNTQKLIGRHLIIFFSWFVASFSFYGVSYNVGSLGGNVYLNMATGALMDIGSFLLCAPFMTRFGRRPLSSVLFFVTGVACIATLFPVIYASEDQQWMTVVLALMGRCSMAVVFAFIWVYSSELFPTVMRNSGHGAASVCARLGGLVAPYVANMSLDGAAGKAIPLVIFGVPSIVVSLLTLCLPETLNRSLPDSVEDAVSMSR
ncbi:uncharacterized protein LOC143299160 [Babylonia areolata]|uniref:uncharacterized protein LOC143299160 n=1 Tax=Babylonia areolata TaxID=304850 RepID=UPI003FD1EDE7